MSAYVEKRIQCDLGTTRELVEASGLRLDAELLAVLRAYQSVRTSTNALALRKCAERAFRECKRAEAIPKSMVLTEWGVCPARERVVCEVNIVEYSAADGCTQEGNRAAKTKELLPMMVDVLAEANATFLRSWLELCEGMEKKQSAESDRESTELINGNKHLFPTLGAVGTTLESDGFELVNRAILDTPNVEIMTHGLVIKAKKGPVERRVTLMPDGSILTHVEHPGSGASTCREAAGLLADKIGFAVVETLRESGLFAISMLTTRSGPGEGPKSDGKDGRGGPAVLSGHRTNTIRGVQKILKS